MPTDPHLVAAEERRFREFVANFDVLTIPGCEIGMRLLLVLRDNNPEAYAIAGEYFWAYTDDPRLAEVPEWMAFARHYNECEACNAC